MTAEAMAIGIDIGGTGIKGASVDLGGGLLLSDRMKLPTPEGGRPRDIVATVERILEAIPDVPSSTPVGICFPAAVVHGRTMSAANVSDEWIGLEAEKLFEDAIGRNISFVNDADAAGYAESRFGAAKDKGGLVIMTTLGTGIGTAQIYNGVLIPNAELGHLEIHGGDYEKKASFAAKERDDLDYKHWAKRLQRYYSHLEALLWPDLFIVGGGISKHHEEFLPLLELRTPIVPAALRNNAGILGAAALAGGGPS
ncbi:polyphosphate--glucose phosphotransferase [Rathayibacter iranicus]|uniref:ROK family protein n=2 Tax=Rathayibacter iranicus TaxID=59737 RepID=A0AAD1ENM9_9MICO|nr:ROK family protein [Rathayibacter iranicus]AZZ57316.1 ROK family protein [Rathayibacter iranicus]MWV31489.1 ROK family protein [Rathayibacter iranicus NCPPB 2253 = VKM Ac-1602]PPI49241.1 polyphosphate glucokinase [Rathayibacter iranicus]PPI61682.1 polyphosphate glucokinase [Rathayibacter iranicus]PPI72409.1 polyphosphate glucokinase [Rathayibacter iranicus]